MEEIWNREELYAEVWEKPLVKVAARYDISAVALGKVCKKLQIPAGGAKNECDAQNEKRSAKLESGAAPLLSKGCGF